MKSTSRYTLRSLTSSVSSSISSSITRFGSRSGSRAPGSIRVSPSRIAKPNVRKRRGQGQQQSQRNRIIGARQHVVTQQTPQLEGMRSCDSRQMHHKESCVTLSMEDTTFTMPPQRLDMSGLEAFASCLTEQEKSVFEARCQQLTTRVINLGQRATRPGNSPHEHKELVARIVDALDQIHDLVADLAKTHEDTGGSRLMTWANQKRIHIATERAAWGRLLG